MYLGAQAELPDRASLFPPWSGLSLHPADTHGLPCQSSTEGRPRVMNPSYGPPRQSSADDRAWVVNPSHGRPRCQSSADDRAQVVNPSHGRPRQLSALTEVVCVLKTASNGGAGDPWKAYLDIR